MGALFPLYYRNNKDSHHQHFVLKRDKGLFPSILKLQQKDNVNEKHDENLPNRIKISTNSLFLFNWRNLMKKKIITGIEDYADLYGEITCLDLEEGE